VHHTPGRFLETRLANMMTSLFLHYHSTDIRIQLSIGSATHHYTLQIVIALRKQAGPDLSI
jgi:hypothetical protein